MTYYFDDSKKEIVIKKYNKYESLDAFRDVYVRA